MLFFLSLSFSGDDDALLIFLFSLVLFSPSIELEKRYSRAGQQSTRPSQIYTSCAKKQSTTTTQHQKALYLRESMEIYIHIMCLFRECSFLSLSSLSLYWTTAGILGDCIWATDAWQYIAQRHYIYIPQDFSFIAIDYIPPIWRVLWKNILVQKFSFFLKKGGNGPNIFGQHGIDFMSFARVEGSFILISLPLDYFITEYSSVCVIIFSSYLDSFFSYFRLLSRVCGHLWMMDGLCFVCHVYIVATPFHYAWWWWMINGTTHTHTGVFFLFLIPFGWL